jgi:transposase
MRFGTRTELKRRWSISGHKPVLRVNIGYETMYLYTAINPYKGDFYALILPRMSTPAFHLLLEEIHLATGSKRTLIIGDKASIHQNHPNIPSLIFHPLPTGCPELNPVERFFLELRRDFANSCFDSIDQAIDKVVQLVQPYYHNKQLLQSIAGFPYIKCVS